LLLALSKCCRVDSSGAAMSSFRDSLESLQTIEILLVFDN